MDKKLKEIQTILESCKRKSDRLPIPLTIHYASSPGLHWSGPIVIENISGGGLKFKHKKKLKTKALYNVKVNLPNITNPIMSKARVVWCQDLSTKDKAAAPLYDIGIEFTKMKETDRKIFVSYLCEEILFNYLSQDNLTKSLA